VDSKQLFRAQLEAKALAPHPAFMDPGNPVGLVDLNLGKIAGKNPNDTTPGGPRLAQRGAGRYLSAYGGENAIDLVMDCVRYVGDTVANAEYHFEKPETFSATRKPGEPVRAPEQLVNLFKKPNPYMDYIEMMEMLVMDLLLTGNAYWFKWRSNQLGQPLALYRLAPPYVEVVTKPWGPGTYVYQIPNAAKLEIDPTDVIHLRLSNPDPANPYYGMGLMQGAGRYADLEIALTDTQASYMENHAMPSVAVESERRVPRDVFKKIRAQLRARAAGPKNAGELLVLEAGLKLNSIAPSAGDAGFAELSKLSRDRVFAWFRMNPKLLGLSDEATTEPLHEAQQHFDNKTARPLMNKIQKKLSDELVAAWNLEYVINYEYQLSPEEQAHMAGSFGMLPGITVDELRKFAGLGPHPDKKIGEITLNLPGEEAEGGEKKAGEGFPDPGLPGEKGRPANRANTKAFPKPGKTLPPGSKAIAPNAKPAKKGKKSLDDLRADLYASNLRHGNIHARHPAPKTLDEIMDRLTEIEHKALTQPAKVSIGNKLDDEMRPEDQLADKRVADVDAVVSDFEADLGKAARVLERGLLDTAEGKAFKASDVVMRLRNSDSWKAFTELATEAYEKALLRVMSQAAIHHSEVGLKPAGEIDYEALVDELVARKDSGVAAITASFKKQLADKVKEARTGESTLADIQTEIQNTVAHWAESDAYGIALTEATRGYNESTLAVAEGSGLTHVVVSDGTDSDEACADADGQLWTLEQARENPLEHPRCRRAFVPVPAT
jgi:HK97 family phage portal protein